MKKHLHTQAIVLIVVFLTGVTGVSQTVAPLTSGESTAADSNFETFYTIDGVGYYTSYVHDVVNLYHIDTDSLIYSTSFRLCEEEIVEWIVYGHEVIYVSYYDIIIENIYDGSSEIINYNENLDFDFGHNSITASVFQEILQVTKYPGPERLMYDLANRRFLTDYPPNLVFATDDYFYYSEGFSDARFMRIHRESQKRDTLQSNYTTEGNIAISGKYFLVSKEKPILSVDQNDVIRTYDFDHQRIASGVETSTGKLVCSEFFQGGTIIYTLDIDSGALLAKDSLLLERPISLLDSYGDRIYVSYNTQWYDAYGYIEPPYSEVTVMTPDYEFFSVVYKSKNQELLIFENYRHGYRRNFLVHEKSTNENTEFSLESFYNSADDITAAVDTDDGMRLVMLETSGKVVYSFDTETNSVVETNHITNERGLGTDVLQNGDGYLLGSDHSTQNYFEYIHPVTKELLKHEVDGIIHGSAIPYGGKYFYVRNQTYQGIDEDFILDFIRFDPRTDEVKIITEDFYYPQDNVSIYNINFTPDPSFGFLNIYNINLTFDLANEEEVTTDSATKDLLSNVFLETPLHYYAHTSWPSQLVYRINKTNYQDRTLISTNYVEFHRRIDEESFVAVLSNGVKIVTATDVLDVPVPPGFNYQRTGFLDNTILMIWIDDDDVRLDMYDIATAETQSTIVEGWPAFLAGDYLISFTAFEPIETYASMHLEDGTTHYLSPDRPLTYLYNNDSLFYFIDREVSTINIYRTDWTEVEIMETEAFKNAEFNLVSEIGQLPLIYSLKRPRSSGQYRNSPDRSLVLFDPISRSIDEWFLCDDEYRYRKFFKWSDNALVLLHNEEMGYQICEIEIPNFQITNTTDEKTDVNQHIEISPNPASQSICISINYKRLEVFNAMGILTLTSVQNDPIDISSLQPGTYFLHITDEQDNRFVKKLIKI